MRAPRFAPELSPFLRAAFERRGEWRGEFPPRIDEAAHSQASGRRDARLSPAALRDALERPSFSEMKIAGKRATVCRMNVWKERLQLFLRYDTGVPIKRLDRLAALLRA